MVPRDDTPPAGETPAAPDKQSGTQMMEEAERLSSELGQQTSPKTDDEVLAFLDADIGAQAAFQSPKEAPEAKPAPEPKKEPKAKEEPAEEPEAPETPAPVEEESDQDLERALAALRRYKTPDPVLKGMDREQLIQWGSHLAKIQGDYDKTYADLSERKAEASDANAEEQVPTRAEAAPTVDLAETTRKLAEVLGLDEQDGQILGQVFEGAVGPLQKELADRGQRDAARDEAVASLLVDNARSRLVERFPQLGDDARFGPVRDKMQQLISGGGYDSVQSAMEDAATVLFSKEILAAQASQQEKKNSAKAKGRPAAPSSPPPPEALSHDERLGVVLAKLEAGATQEEARTAAGW